MKNCIILFLLFTCCIKSFAQDNAAYYSLEPGQKALIPGEKLDLNVICLQLALPTWVPASSVVRWNVNGHEINALSPSDGTLDVNTASAQAVYTAPLAPPEKNPVAVSVTLQMPNSKEQLTLVCNVTIVKPQYKITMEAENIMDASGRDIKLRGECYASLKALDDGTYMLEPVDKTRNMNVTIEKNTTVNAGGATGQIVFPTQYTFPFLFSIAALDKNTASGEATVYLNTTAPQNGMVKSEITSAGETVTTIVNIDEGAVTTIAPNFTQTYQVPESNLYSMSGIAPLNLLSGLMSNTNTVIQNVAQNNSSAMDKLELMKRIQAHQNDPAYFKTAKGKADLKAMQSMNVQIGGNITNEWSGEQREDVAEKIKNKPGYAGSEEMKKDIAQLQLSRKKDERVYGKKATAEVTPGRAVVRMEGTFNAKSATAFTGTLENTPGGVMNTSIKIRVEKMN